MYRCFGADVLTQLPEALQKKIEPYRALYDIGLHGPDLLFYYKALQSNPVNRLGNAMHEQPGTVFFERARGVIRNAKNRDAALVYVTRSTENLPRGASENKSHAEKKSLKVKQANKNIPVDTLPKWKCASAIGVISLPCHLHLRWYGRFSALSAASNATYRTRRSSTGGL